MMNASSRVCTFVHVGWSGPRCCVEVASPGSEHDGPHLFRCASPLCPGLPTPASEQGHPFNCGAEKATAYTIRGFRPCVRWVVGSHSFEFTLADALGLASRIESTEAEDINGVQLVPVSVPGAVMYLPIDEARAIPAMLRSAVEYATSVLQ